MLEFPTLAKAPDVVNVVPVAILVIVALWLFRKLAKLAVLLLVAAAGVGVFLWMRGGV